MADVRSLLRQQRAARQQAKPQKQSSVPAVAPTSKKRKAPDEQVQERKRTRTEEEAGVPAGFFDDAAVTDESFDTAVPDDAAMQTETTHAPATPEPPPPEPAADAELDAFLTEMEQVAKSQPETDPYSGAVIEAAPMTAAEIAAQARDDLNAQRARRDEEMEGEKEDAARALEEEFDEMDGLEDRVRRLRAQREALRNKPVEAKAADEDIVLPTPQPEDDDDDESDLDEDEDWDDWRFHPA